MDKIMIMGDGELEFDIKNWGGYAECYDALMELEPYRKLQTIVASELGVINEQTILEAACGTGNLTQMLLETNRGPFELHSLDFSPEMLYRARQKCMSPFVIFDEADLNTVLGYPNDGWDRSQNCVWLF